MRLGNCFKLLSVVLALGLSQCGGHTISNDITIQIVPPQPTVFAGGYTYTNASGEQTTLQGPWLSFQVYIANNSGGSSGDPPLGLVIEAINVTITDNLNPANAPVTVTLSPATDGYSNDTSTCIFSDYGEFDVGGSSTGSPPYNSNMSDPDQSHYNDTLLFEIPTTGSISCPVNVPKLYLSGLPSTSTTQTNFSYTVQIQPVGWFGTRESQVERFTNFTYFTTQ